MSLTVPLSSPLKLAPPDTTTLRMGWPGFIGVDEGLDQLFRWDPFGDKMRWITALDMKCRTLQRLSQSRILGVNDRGYFEVDLESGSIVRWVRLEAMGVIAASRRSNGCTFLAGIDLAERHGVTFTEYDSDDRLLRVSSFPGDYVRGATLTESDTILFTNNDRVMEGDWSGRIIREFAAPEFKHAWKALRLKNGHTLISAGYGAYIVEFDAQASEVRRWQCETDLAFIRPFFFGDFTLLGDGSLVVCNWLGHGIGQGGTGCALLRFDATGSIVKVWQDAERSSSVQAFELIES